MDNSCKDCTKRKVGCHSTCEIYKQYKLETTKRNKKIRDMKYLDSLHRR